MTTVKIPSREGQKASAFGVGCSGSGQPTPAPLQSRGLIFIPRELQPMGDSLPVPISSEAWKAASQHNWEDNEDRDGANRSPPEPHLPAPASRSLPPPP